MPALCVFCVMLRFKCPVLSAYSKKRPLYNCHNSHTHWFSFRSGLPFLLCCLAGIVFVCIFCRNWWGARLVQMLVCWTRTSSGDVWISMAWLFSWCFAFLTPPIRSKCQDCLCKLYLVFQIMVGCLLNLAALVFYFIFYNIYLCFYVKVTLIFIGDICSCMEYVSYS